MNKAIVLSILTFITSLVSFSQNDSLLIKVVAAGQGQIIPTQDNTDYSSGHTPYAFNISTLGLVEIYIQVENNTLEDKSWRVTRYNENDVPSTWSSHMLWSSCFVVSASNPWCSPENSPFNVASNSYSEMGININVSEIGTGTYTLFLGDCNNFDDSVKIQINNMVGIDELNQAPSFSMYPNPANDLVSIQLNNSKNGMVKIVDLVGNVVYTEVISSSKTLNTSEFKNGIYFVTIESEGKRMRSRKLVVKH